MDIAIITATPQSLTHGSGTFVTTENLRHGLEALGHEVTLVTPGWTTLPRPYAFRRWLCNRALSTADVEHADLVIGIDLDGFAVAPRVRGTFVTYVLGQMADEAQFEHGLTRASMRLQARWERQAVHRAAVVATVSEYGRTRIAQLYGVSARRVVVVPPGFDADAWTRRVDASRPNPPPVTPTVLAVAHLYARKNLGALIAAARVLADRRVPACVRIVGDGPERRRLERLVQRYCMDDTVELAGYVDEETLPAEFARAAVFCLPSLQEGFGLVYLQAMAARLPVVALRASSTPEVVEHGVTGLLARPRDPTSLADAIERLLGDDALRARFGATGHARAREFSTTVTASRLLDAVQNAARVATASRSG